jgi:hypothetical protein
MLREKRKPHRGELRRDVFIEHHFSPKDMTHNLPNQLAVESIEATLDTNKNSFLRFRLGIFICKSEK